MGSRVWACEPARMHATCEEQGQQCTSATPYNTQRRRSPVRTTSYGHMPGVARRFTLPVFANGASPLSSNHPPAQGQLTRNIPWRPGTAVRRPRRELAPLTTLAPLHRTHRRLTARARKRHPPGLTTTDTTRPPTEPTYLPTPPRAAQPEPVCDLAAAHADLAVPSMREHDQVLALHH